MFHKTGEPQHKQAVLRSQKESPKKGVRADARTPFFGILLANL